MRYLSIAIAAAALLAFGNAAQASPKTHSSSPTIQSFSGTIESIDHERSAIVVRKDVDGKVMEKEFHLDPNAWITLDGAINTLSSLEPGDSVTVQYRVPKGMK